MAPRGTRPPRAVEVLRDLDDTDRTRARHLAGEVEAADGVAALSEQSLLELRTPVRPVRHLLVRAEDDALAGYAQVDLEGGSAELAVHPSARRRGLGGALLAELRELAPGVAVWAHGDLPAAQALARSAGLDRTRELWQMATELTGEEPEPPTPPPGVTVRHFTPGQDDQAWVSLNARAFVDHPEQGRLTVADLHARQAEDWFDPTLLWLAVPTEEPTTPVASMWVKVLPEDSSGEIYALGVHPEHQGRGLGRVLTAVALHEMGQRGLTHATLYVEGDNAPAIRTYRAAGFTRTALDVQYR